MFRTFARTGVALLFLGASFANPSAAIAQIAPTNTATVSGSVTERTGRPIASARISIDGPKSDSTRTDARGLFAFVGLPFGTYRVSVSAATFTTVMQTVKIENDVNIAIELTTEQSLRMIASVRSTSAFNVTPASVTQVNPIQNAFEGKTSWRTILEQIPGVAQAGLGTGNSNYVSMPDSPFMPMEISINGTLPYETATLVDDMPLISGGSAFNGGVYAGSGTDIGFYALNGFGSADVVRGPGANAPSIVNSVGGSFVLHPLGPVETNHSEFSFSSDPYGGIVSNSLAAFRWKKLSLVATYGVNDSPGPLNQSTVPATTIFNPLTVNGSTFRCAGLCVRQFLLSPGFSSSSFAYYGYQTGLLTCCYQASSAWSQHSGSIALNYAVSPSVNAAIFYSGQSSAGATTTYPSVSDMFTPPAGYTGSIPAGLNILNATGEYLQPSPLQNTSNLLEEKVTAQLGRGFLRFAALQDRVYSSSSTNFPSSLSLQLFGGGCIASAPGGTGGCPVGFAPIVFNGGSYNATFRALTSAGQQNSNNRDLLFSYATPLGDRLNAGASFVRSYYDIPSQFVQSIPSLNSNTISTISSAASQTTDEFRVFVGGALSERTSLDLSGYFVNAHYHVANPVGYSSTTGTSTNGWLDPSFSYAAPRLGFVWRPTAAISIRAAAGGGFAEAPLAYLVGSSAATPNCSSGVYCTVSLTNINLQPEKSFGFDVGADVRLANATILSLDVYRTNLFGQFYSSTSATGTYLGLPLYTTQTGNLGTSRYTGILLDLRHDVARGTYWGLSGGLTRGYVVSVPPGFYNNPSTPCTNCINLNVVPGVNFNGTFAGVSVPYSQARGTLGYRWAPRTFIDLVGSYYGNNNTYYRPAFLEWDGHASYGISRTISLMLTLRNMTGIYGGPIVTYSSGNFVGVPAISGPPYAEWSENYGPRTAILTADFRLP